MADFIQSMANPADMSESAQVKAGTPAAGDMDAEYKNFLKTITALFDKGEIDVTKPETFLNKAIYDKLSEEWKSKTDLALMNIATLLDHIHSFYVSKQTPDSSPQLATMIEQLWDMKQRIEVHADVFKF